MLKIRIAWKRRKMHITAARYGLTDEKTVICSQELDVLLNKYQHSKKGVFIQSYRSTMK
ncbi:aspartyl-phosphate phosphatase Spo0E family protein [Alteribacillus iranensis]|uniref:aspartyl-phosphate phosphatase Spo0E family protein n=1 Tax=Alteribacillus iranensis TaxID=930128 RepID=UPI0011607C14|nr:aspartyl-phosphate phosphatase Spo0E family protein [Alteribacillus iranensis]